jgi:hypothetical protein
MIVKDKVDIAGKASKFEMFRKPQIAHKKPGNL